MGLADEWEFATGHEVRAAVLALKHCGLSDRRISIVLGVPRRNVGWYLANPRSQKSSERGGDGIRSVAAWLDAAAQFGSEEDANHVLDRVIALGRSGELAASICQRLNGPARVEVWGRIGA